MAVRITVHASPLLLQRGVQGVTGQPMEIVVHLPTSPALSVQGFEVDSAFPVPTLLGSLAGMVRAAGERSEARLLLFGHTDERGGDAHNKQLSDRRAKAVLALLTQDLSALDAVAREDGWSHAEYQKVLTALGAAEGDDPGKGVRMFQRHYRGRWSARRRRALRGVAPE